MPRIAVTGHRDLDDTTAGVIRAAFDARIAELTVEGRVVGVSCLADGADALFAAAVLDAGGDLVAVIPAEKYRDGLPAAYRPEYDRLLGAALDVIRLDHVEVTARAYTDAGLASLVGADELIAVWDGRPAAGSGGSADVVAQAREQGVPVTVIWPDGARRG
ncbi:hypothetical protein [Stackebrandtia albiflava]|uniref:hypothetical protein n=1 Tax=Stackebrandtia albiflava TaxID=406432 RepID=UPI0011BDC3A7|nr:hypothetical protein [Stackebrandtia albiflava]